MVTRPKHLNPTRDGGGSPHRNGDDADPPQLPPEVIERLGELLCGFYRQLTAQPIPENLRRLLDRLDQPGKADHGR